MHSLKTLLIFFVVGHLGTASTAKVLSQTTNTFSTAATSDPEATALLEKMQETLESYPAIEIAFTLNYTIPNQEDQAYEGSVFQQGDAYTLEFPGYLVMSDGETRWVYQDEINELQIYNAGDNPEGYDTPLDYISMATSEEYASILAGETTEDGHRYQSIEFKPLDSESEYSKMRLLVDPLTHLPYQLILFGKDATRTFITLDSITKAVEKKKDAFQFDVDQYPGVYIEDLRID